MWRIPLLVAAAVALFWLGYFHLVGEVPTVETVQLTGSMTDEGTFLQLPYPASLWTGVLFAAIWTFVLISILTSKRVFLNLNPRLVLIGLFSGVFLGLLSRLGSSLALGLSVGLFVGLMIGLDVGSNYNFTLGYGLGFGLIYGISAGIFFGVVASLSAILVTLSGIGLGVVISFFCSPTPYKWCYKWVTAGDKE